jgi:zinc protease
MSRPNRQTLCERVAIALLAGSPLFTTISRVAASNIERQRLDNGLSLLLCASKATDQVALVVLYAVGEDHDPPEKCGLAHLTEHLYLTAAAGDVPARTVDEFMRRYPNAWNAQTGTDYTVFATVFPKGRFEEELRDAAARMGDLRPSKADLDREKLRLLQELRNMYGGFPPLASINHARAHIRPSTIGHRKGGLPEHVQRMSVDDVSQWWSKYYKPTNATVVLAGAFAPEAARELVAKHFASIPSGEKPPPVRKPGPAKPGRTTTVPIEPTSPNAQPHACIAFPAPQPLEKHYAACLLLVNRMWMRAASPGGQLQVVFSVLDDPTLIAVSARVSPHETSDQTVAGLRSFVEQATTAPLQPFEKPATKNNFGVLLGLVAFPDMMFKQNLYGVAFSIGRREQLRLDSTALSKQLDSLTDEAIKAAGQAIFGPEQQAAVVVKPES